MNVKTLIVNADDYGLTPAVSAGIREAHTRGIVTSTTAMMNMPTVEEALRSARRECPDLGIGVHLNLVEGEPLTPPTQIPSLVDSEGRLSLYRSMIDPDRVNPDEVETELRAQVARFVDLAGPPTHLDAHYHSTLLYPAYWRIMVRIAQELHVPVRCFPKPELRAAIIPSTVPAHDEMIAFAMERGVRYPDTLELRFHQDGVSFEMLESIISELPTGVTELMCHPGRCDDALEGYRELRERELELLIDPRVRARIMADGVTLASYRAL